jgi:GNAT superfamily N-acetyltransferase
MNSTERLDITRDLEPKADDLAQVRAGLMTFNESQVGPARADRFAVYLRDGHGIIHGGLVGFFAWNWMSVDWLWVRDGLQLRGHGSALLREAEAMAREAGCVGVKLDTYEFQARPFYEKHGYQVFGVLEGYPAGTRTYYLQKALSAGPL